MGDDRLFDVEISCPDDALAVGALSSASFMMNWAYLHLSLIHIYLLVVNGDVAADIHTLNVDNMDVIMKDGWIVDAGTFGEGNKYSE